MQEPSINITDIMKTKHNTTKHNNPKKTKKTHLQMLFSMAVINNMLFYGFIL